MIEMILGEKSLTSRWRNCSPFTAFIRVIERERPQYQVKLLLLDAVK